MIGQMSDYNNKYLFMIMMIWSLIYVIIVFIELGVRLDFQSHKVGVCPRAPDLQEAPKP